MNVKTTWKHFIKSFGKEDVVALTFIQKFVLDENPYHYSVKKLTWF